MDVPLLLSSQDTVKERCGKIDKKRKHKCICNSAVFEKFAALRKEVPFCEALLLLQKDTSIVVTPHGIVTSI